MTGFQKVIKYCAIAFALFLIISIISGIVGAVGALVYWTKGDADAVGPMQTYEVSNNVQNLDLEISAAELKIVSGSYFQVESNHNYLTVKEENGTLRISEKKVFTGASVKDVQVVLTVPEGFVFDEASIETGAGKVSINALSAYELSMDLGAGQTTIETLNVLSRGSISTGAGEVIIRGGEMQNLSLDHGVGRLSLQGRLEGVCDVDFGIGEAELKLLGSAEDYKITLDKGLGDATMDGVPMADDGVYGTGPNRIKLNGGIGAIRVRFVEE